MADSSEKPNQTQPISMEQKEKMFQMFQKLQTENQLKIINTYITPLTVKIAEKL